MPRPKATRLYLRTNRTEYRRLAWLQNNRTNELILGLYGLTGDQPILRYVWPEREITTADFESVACDLDQAKKVDVLVDHVTAEHRVSFHAMFSGVNYDVDSELAATMPQAGTNHERIRFHSKTLKGTLIGWQEKLPEQTRDTSLHGTLLSIEFPVDEKRWHIKSFLFE